MLPSEEIANETGCALERNAVFRRLEPAVGAARRHAPWHLWLDKFAWAFAGRVDLGKEIRETERKKANDAANAASKKGQLQAEKTCKEKAHALRDMLKQIPSGKACALRVAEELRASSMALNEACSSRDRWVAALCRQLGETRVRVLELENATPLLIHLGRPNTMKNVGLYADRTTGLPLIPGTAVKGVLSTWLAWLAGKSGDTEGARRELAARILGSDAPDGSDHAGNVIFLGAFPRESPPLTIDLVNPHHTEALDPGTGHWTVSDAENLNPSPFLGVARGVKWRFVFYTRAGVPENEMLLNHTSAWLREALTTLGIGAKTASGYGRFKGEDEGVARAAMPTLELAAQVRNRMTWNNSLQPQVQAWVSGGDADALGYLLTEAHEHLNRLILHDFLGKLTTWIAQSSPPAGSSAPIATATPAIDFLALERKVFAFGLLTAGFAGTALGQHAEMRVAPIRGHVRAWHRALFGAGDCAAVWGSSSGSNPAGSRVAVQIAGTSLESQKAAPTLPHKRHGNSDRPALAPGTQFSLIASRLPGCSDDQWANAQAAVELWLVAGGVGLRSRRAAGSVWPESTAPADRASLISALTGLKNVGWRAALIGLAQGKTAVELRETASDTLSGNENLFGQANPKRIPSPVRFKVVRLASAHALLAISSPGTQLSQAETDLNGKGSPARWNALDAWDHLF